METTRLSMALARATIATPIPGGGEQRADYAHTLCKVLVSQSGGTSAKLLLQGADGHVIVSVEPDTTERAQREIAVTEALGQRAGNGMPALQLFEQSPRLGIKLWVAGDWQRVQLNCYAESECERMLAILGELGCYAAKPGPAPSTVRPAQPLPAQPLLAQPRLLAEPEPEPRPTPPPGATPRSLHELCMQDEVWQLCERMVAEDASFWRVLKQLAREHGGIGDP